MPCGPLVDLDGRVVGINTSIANLGGRGSGNIGIGFAVPIDRALDLARQILAADAALLLATLQADAELRPGRVRTNTPRQAQSMGS